MEQIRVFPRSSAFEALLSKVYLELWELQDNPTMFASRVNIFANFFLPTMFQEKVSDKFKDLSDDLARMNERIKQLKETRKNSDPFTRDKIDTQAIPTEEAEFAMGVWHKIVDVLTDAGFNFPVSKAHERRLMRA